MNILKCDRNPLKTAIAFFWGLIAKWQVQQLATFWLLFAVSGLEAFHIMRKIYHAGITLVKLREVKNAIATGLVLWRSQF
ncbi:MAG: hypothetical protein RMY29_014540 [Nostoc sp. CreGUA01]